MSSSVQSLVHSKLDQATKILDELDIDLWLTFTRESSMLPDPALELILNKNVTWRSVFLISRSGKHTAIIGHFDADNVKSLNSYHQVVGYHKDLGGPLLSATVETGNVFTLELHVVVPGRGIVSLEEDVLVTENGVKYLSNPQTALRYIGKRS